VPSDLQLALGSLRSEKSLTLYASHSGHGRTRPEDQAGRTQYGGWASQYVESQPEGGPESGWERLG
jgi:hypothetical protein